jgi:hypothetical protein
MSSSTHRRKHKRERQRYPEPEDRGNDNSESRPRTYDHEPEPPEEALSRLQINSGGEEMYYPDENVGQSSRGTREKGKWKQSRDEGSEWSQWLWNTQDNYYYSTRMTPSGEYEYQYDTTSPRPVDSRDQIQSEVQSPRDSSWSAPNYTTSTQTMNSAIPPFAPNSAQALGYPPTPQYETGAMASNAGYSGGSYDTQQAPQDYSSAVYRKPEAYSTSVQNQLPPVMLPAPINFPCGCCDPGLKKNLCRVLIWPKEPGPTDGKFNEYAASTKSISIRVRTRNSCLKLCGRTVPIDLFKQGPDGKGCGPLWLPGITPGPAPKKPSGSASIREREKYKDNLEKWNKGYEEWKQITCPCGFGYFDVNGVWISGGEAREKKRNPLWKATGGRAPYAKGKLNDKKHLSLCERGQAGKFRLANTQL